MSFAGRRVLSSSRRATCPVRTADVWHPANPYIAMWLQERPAEPALWLHRQTQTVPVNSFCGELVRALSVPPWRIYDRF